MAFYTSVYVDGNTIYDRFIDEDGSDHIRKVRFSPTLYRHVPNHIESDLVDIYGKRCAPKTFESIGEARKWMRTMGDRNQDVLGMDNFVFQYITETYGSDLAYNFEKLDIWFLDIEVPTSGIFPKPELHLFEVDTIQVYSTKFKKYFIWTTREWSSDKSELKEETLCDVEYKKCGSEKEVLTRFLVFFCENYPHYLSGWNSEAFDIPYLVNRIRVVLGDKFVERLSPFGKVSSTIVEVEEGDDGEQNEIVTYNIEGINCIDFMAAYKKFTFTTRPNYKLDTIAKAELDIEKIEVNYRSYLEFAEKDSQKYIDYSIRDVEIIKRLEERLSLIYLVSSVAYYAGINAADTFSPLKTWDAIIYNSLLGQGIIIPENKHAQRSKFAGAFVKEPKPGLYKWIMSFDLTSLDK